MPRPARGIIDLLFARRAETGATLVIITHDEALAEHCDRVVTLADGRIASDTVRDHPPAREGSGGGRQ